MSKPHGERKHSKFSASGAERWFACPGSIALSEGLPDKSSPWAEEGTRAHEILEKILKHQAFGSAHEKEMLTHAMNAAKDIWKVQSKHPDSDLLAEQRVYLDFIHPEAFGTLDAAVVDYFGTLHVFDFKYGAGHSVSPKENLQMLFYALALAHAHHWNFKRVRLWIVQPRIRGYDGPVFWELSLSELRDFIPLFQAAVDRVEKSPNEYAEGGHCHWCKAKSICPLKREAKLNAAVEIFKLNPPPKKGDKTNGKKESKEKSGKEGREESSEKENQIFKSEADWKRAKALKAKEKANARRRASALDFY